MTVGLDKVPVGQTCQIYSIEATGVIRRRLLDLGFVPGAIVSSVRRAALGDPTVYSVKGAQIALRREEAVLVQVEL